MEAHLTLEIENVKGDKTYVEAHLTLEIENVKGDKTYVQAHLTLEIENVKGDKTYVEAHPTLEIENVKGDKTYVEAPGCGGPWAAFSSGAVEAHFTLEYQNVKGDICGGPLVLEAHLTLEYQNVKGDICGGPLVVEAPWLWRPLGKMRPCNTGLFLLPTVFIHRDAIPTAAHFSKTASTLVRVGVMGPHQVASVNCVQTKTRCCLYFQTNSRRKQRTKTK